MGDCCNNMDKMYNFFPVHQWTMRAIRSRLMDTLILYKFEYSRFVGDCTFRCNVRSAFSTVLFVYISCNVDTFHI